MILIFFRNGEPNISVSIIAANDRNPRPMNSGEPHLISIFLNYSYKQNKSARLTEVVVER